MHLIVFLAFQLTLSLQDCQVQNCESCSFQSSKICINCEVGYSRDLIKGCIKTEDDKRFEIENCELISLDSICLTCKSGFILLNNRCEPGCYSDCVCFSPYKCVKNIGEEIELNENEGRSLYDSYYDESSSSSSSSSGSSTTVVIAITVPIGSVSLIGV